MASCRVLGDQVGALEAWNSSDERVVDVAFLGFRHRQIAIGPRLVGRAVTMMRFDR